ncbi:hypothetical protein P7C73_g4684, partial [Tremellales sp. Uapishka_1]
MTASTKTIVVLGATGQQGSALIHFLAESNVFLPKYDIIALTRVTRSKSAQRLAQIPRVKVVAVPKDVMDEPERSFAQIGLKKGEVYGMFSVQGYVDAKTETRQGKAVVDAAQKLGVEHFIHSSTDIGFNVKIVVEDYIKTLDPPMGYTMLRPAQFMDNLLPTASFMFKMGRTVLLQRTFTHHPERKHQMISARDIGRAGAMALEHPDQWKGREIRLAGDEFTMPELQKIYSEIMGRPIETAPWILGLMVKSFVSLMSEAAGVSGWLRKLLQSEDDRSYPLTAQFWDDVGYGIDIPALKKDMPELEDLRTFLTRYKEARK